jgi:hypothetical protein
MQPSRASDFRKVSRIVCRRFVILLPLLFCFSNCCLPKHPVASVRLLTSAVHSEQLQKETSPRRMRVNYTVQGRAHRGDVYLPSRSRAGILFVPGAVAEGKDDPRLVSFANALARANFAVLVPDREAVRELKIGARDIREVADGFAYLASRPDLAPEGRAGIAAPSYALGPTVLAALEPDIREQVQFIFGIGGYYDLRQVIAFFTTGYFREGERWRHVRPNESGKWLFARNNADRLSDSSDRAIIRAIAKRKMENPDAAVERLVAQLHREGRDLFELLTNKDPQRVPELIEKLPKAVRTDIAALDLARHDLSALRARLILVHGFDDAMIPYTQSKALARAAPPGKARVYLVHRLAHVDVDGVAPADVLKLLCAIDALLTEQTRR